jgi:DNA-binding transcriptional LysR family regulator
MELRHLRYFVVVAEELNLRRAAARLNISHPPLSRQIQDLEREVGVALVVRAKRGIALTDAGAVFVVEARRILAHAAQAIEEAREVPRGSAGRLRIAYSFGYFEPSLGRVMKVFRARFPKVKIEIQQLGPRQQIEALRRKSIDIAYPGLRFAAAQEDIHFECIRRAPIHVALPAGHELLESPGLALTALAGENFVSLGGVFYDYRAWLEKLCAGAGFQPKIMHEVDSSSTMFGLVAAGFGVAVLPALHDPPASAVEFRPIRPARAKFDFFIAWRLGDSAPALLNYVGMVREEVGVM